MFNERKIRVFLHVSRTKSFTKSAQQLFMTQQAVSKTVADLEADVGKKLFTRGYRSLELTPEGKECRHIFINFMRAYDDFTNQQIPSQSRKIIIHVGYLKFCGYGAEFGEAFAKLRRDHPNISFVPETLTPEELIAKLENGSLDLVFTRDVLLPTEHNFSVREITDNQLYLATSAYIPLNGADPASDFFQMPLIVNAIENESAADAFIRGQAEIQRLGLRTNDVIIAPDRESAMHYAEMGIGVMSISETSLIFQSSGLQFHPMPFYDKTVCAWIDSEFTPLFRDYCDVLQSKFLAKKEA